MTGQDGVQANNSGARTYFSAEQAEGPGDVIARASIVHQDDYPKYEIAQGVIFCPVKGSNLSLNFVTFPPNSGFPSHAHPEEQISIVREGQMEITIGEQTRTVKPGDVIIFPPHVPHAGRTGDRMCRLIDIFSPPRHGMDELIARADPVRSADADRWWKEDS
ncbi:MAG: cupin domain-containing protein [Spirochaetaceae bacterium]|nr:MAG: cupin domain-containing protein [Spirochaetaceae bacterium]